MASHFDEVNSIIEQLDGVVDDAGGRDVPSAALAPVRTALVALRDEPRAAESRRSRE